MENTYAAFCLDEAIIYFGEQLDAELDRVANKAKTERAAEGMQKLTLEKWLADPKEKEKLPNSGFATPVATR